tara:strand:+ start:733 stop:1026 length:294 start_codon:yes stop_codon:yes gene_type:complete
MTRLKMSVTLPENITNYQLSDILGKECSGFEATWLDENSAVFSVNNTKNELKIIFEKYNIVVNDDPCEHLKHSSSSVMVNDEWVVTVAEHTVITSLE